MAGGSGEVDPRLSVRLVDIDFLSIREIGESSRSGKPRLGFFTPQGEGTLKQCQGSRPWRQNSVRQEDFILEGMYQIAKCEKQDWRKKQAEEIREMLFMNQKPESMKMAIKEIKSNLVFEAPDSEAELENLKLASNRLDAAMEKVGSASSLGHPSPVGKESTRMVPATHEAIHSHSCYQLHPQWVWIAKNSTVDRDGRLGFPATREEVRKFRDKVRKVFLRSSPSVLQGSFAQAVRMGRKDERPVKRPWFCRGEAEREFQQEHSHEERDLGAKKQQAIGGQIREWCNSASGWDERGRKYQEEWHGHRREEFRGTNHQGGD
jgi:hypothetical protein